MVGLIASRELKETLRDGRVLMMWVVPVIACAVLQWMLLQTPVFSQPLSEQGDTLHLAYDGPEWLRAVIENDATRLTHDADVTSVDGYSRRRYRLGASDRREPAIAHRQASACHA